MHKNIYFMYHRCVTGLSFKKYRELMYLCIKFCKLDNIVNAQTMDNVKLEKDVLCLHYTAFWLTFSQT